MEQVVILPVWVVERALQQSSLWHFSPCPSSCASSLYRSAGDQLLSSWYTSYFPSCCCSLKQGLFVIYILHPQVLRKESWEEIWEGSTTEGQGICHDSTVTQEVGCESLSLRGLPEVGPLGRDSGGAAGEGQEGGQATQGHHRCPRARVEAHLCFWEGWRDGGLYAVRGQLRRHHEVP